MQPIDLCFFFKLCTYWLMTRRGTATYDEIPIWSRSTSQMQFAIAATYSNLLLLSYNLLLLPYNLLLPPYNLVLPQYNLLFLLFIFGYRWFYFAIFFPYVFQNIIETKKINRFNLNDFFWYLLKFGISRYCVPYISTSNQSS